MINRFFKASLMGALAVGMLMIPFIGMLVGIPLAFICMFTGSLLNAYCKNSEYVEFGFAWVTVHSTHVYFVYWAIFTAAIFIAMLLFGRRSSSQAKEPEQ